MPKSKVLKVLNPPKIKVKISKIKKAKRPKRKGKPSMKNVKRIGEVNQQAMQAPSNASVKEQLSEVM